MLQPPADGLRGAVRAFIQRRALELTGLGLLAAGLALFIALAGHDPYDPSWNHATDAPVDNPLGLSGAVLADLGLQTFGLASWLLALAMIVLGVRLFMHQRVELPLMPLIALPLALLGGSALLGATEHLPPAWPFRTGLGGVTGDYLAYQWQPVIGAAGYRASTAALTLLALAIVVGLRLADLWPAACQGVRALRRTASWLIGGGRWTLAHAGGGFAQAPNALARRSFLGRSVFSRPADDAVDVAGNEEAEADDDLYDDDLYNDGTDDQAPVDLFTHADRERPGSDEPRTKRPRPRRLTDQMAPVAEGAPIIPPLDLLDAHRIDTRALPRTKLDEIARNLEAVLDDFGVRGEIVDVSPGPVVTRYDLEPVRGTKASRVIALADDIARSMCVRSVRISTIPGTTYLGIELPNDHRTMVGLRELLEAEEFKSTGAQLALTLGKDIGGAPRIVDLAPMPHLLIAGTTGSGKSVAINSMILSLLYRLPPERCRFIMVDPKFIELSIYDGIPHLLAPVVTEPGKAIVALKWVVREMDERYRAMQTLRVKHINGYNRRVAEAVRKGEALCREVQTGFDPETGRPVFERQPIDMKPMPMIVVIVDEMADLMLTAGKEVEIAIQRLSSKARAAGIHLIVATQRPSVDVVTGVIKANLPSRISFRVSSKVDSKTILNQQGAEQLLGQGDMLLLESGTEPVRMHGPFVSEAEIERVVAWLKAQAEPDYIEAVTEDISDEPGSTPADFGDPAGTDGDARYQRAVQIVIRDNKPTTSYIQRKLNIGYNSAAKLIERMEQDGIVSAPNHQGKRTLLVGDDRPSGVDAPW